MDWKSFIESRFQDIEKSLHITLSGIVKTCLIAINRQHFTNYATVDSPQSIGCGVTISAPHMHAFALEKSVSYIKKDSNILDVGSGSGYLTACYAYILNSMNGGGKVVGLEIENELVKESQKTINDHYADLKDRIEFVHGDGITYKCSQKFDVIHVGASYSTIPSSLANCLNDGGVLIMPVGHDMKVCTKTNNELKCTTELSVNYVPLHS